MADLLSGIQADRLVLSARRRYGLAASELWHTGSTPLASTLGASRRVFAERLSIGDGNRSLGRQDACGRAPRYAFGPDELGHLGRRIHVGNTVQRALVNHGMLRSQPPHGMIDPRGR